MERASATLRKFCRRVFDWTFNHTGVLRMAYYLKIDKGAERVRLGVSHKHELRSKFGCTINGKRGRGVTEEITEGK